MSLPIVLKTPPVAARFARRIGVYLQFLREFIGHPTTVGAIAPSSTALAFAMLKPIDFTRVRTITELGPGTGSFTEHILNRRQRHSRFIALETNPTFFAHLTGRWGPSSFVDRSAEELREALDEGGFGQVEAIVSGLPWASFRDHRQENILRQVSACLAPQGVFVTFAYLQGLLLPGGIRFQRLLEQQFASVERTKVVWTNVPPAFVYVCRKQACAAQEAA